MAEKKVKGEDKHFYVLSENDNDDSVEPMFYYPFDTAEAAIKTVKETTDLDSGVEIIYIVQVVRKFRVKAEKITLEEFT